MNGVWKFTLTGATKNGGDSDPVGGAITPVYHLDGYHSREDVVRRFREVNPELVESKSTHGLRQMLRSHGRRWYDAIDEVFPP